MNFKNGVISLDNGVSIRLGLIGKPEKPHFHGISEILCSGIPLMDSSFPSSFEFSGPASFVYDCFVPLAWSAKSGTLTLKTCAKGRDVGRIWQRDQYDNDLLEVKRPAPAPEIFIDFIFTGASEKFRGVEFNGVKISWSISGKKDSLARLRWIQHWEFGSGLAGKKLLHQSQISAPFHEFSEGSSWSNVCYKSLEKGAGPENISMQLNPRCAYHQLFDFMYGENRIFLAYFNEAGALQAMSQKNPGENNFFVLDQIDFPLSGSASLPGKTIMISDEIHGLDDLAAKNIWFSVNRVLEDSWRAQTGIEKSRILPTELDGMWETIAIDGKLHFGTLSDHVPAEKYLESLARYKIPKLKKLGFKRFWTRPFCVSDSSELLFWNKALRGRGVMDGDVAFGSCCCAWEYKPSKLFGGVKAAKEFYRIGHEEGMEIGIWVGNHLSTRAPVLSANPDWSLKDASFSNPVGGYDKHVLAPLNWNSGVRDWILKDLLEWKSSCGLDFIFFDSLGNLGLKSRNFADNELRGNFEGLCRFISDLRRNGIEVICEGRSFIGSPYFSISCNGNMKSENDPLVGQNNLAWFKGHEDMLAGIHLFTDKISNSSEESFVSMSFKIIANGGLLKVRECKSEAIFGFYRIFCQVSDLMHDRELLPDSKGVLWHTQNGGKLFFSYQKSRLKLDGVHELRQILPDGICPSHNAHHIDAEALSVYLALPNK